MIAHLVHKGITLVCANQQSPDSVDSVARKLQCKFTRQFFPSKYKRKKVMWLCETTSYSWCGIPKMCIAVHLRNQVTMMAAVFSCTRCRDPYNSLMHMSYGCHKPCAQTGRCYSALYNRYTIPKMRIVVYTPRRELWRKRNFGTTAIWICAVCWLTLPYGCRRNPCTQIGRSRGASYSRCTIPIMRMAIYHPKRTTLMQMAFWCNRCRDLHSLLTYVALRVVSQPLYTNWDIP